MINTNQQNEPAEHHWLNLDIVVFMLRDHIIWWWVLSIGCCSVQNIIGWTAYNRLSLSFSIALIWCPVCWLIPVLYGINSLRLPKLAPPLWSNWVDFQKWEWPPFYDSIFHLFIQILWPFRAVCLRPAREFPHYASILDALRQTCFPSFCSIVYLWPASGFVTW